MTHTKSILIAVIAVSAVAALFAQGAALFAQGTAPPAPIRFASVRPFATATNTWTVPQVPLLNSLSCYLNGLYQSETLDYTLSGRTITSAYWSKGASPTLTCKYSY